MENLHRLLTQQQMDRDEMATRHERERAELRDKHRLAWSEAVAAESTPDLPKSRPRLLIPLYDFPDDQSLKTAWTEVSKIGKSGVVVVNPNSGNFSVASSSYVRAIAQLDAHGVQWIGYVSTDYGRRQLSEIVDDIVTWKKIYPSCGGYFLDEQAKDWNPVYASIAKQCRATIPSGLVVSNPGLTGCDKRYLDIMDVLVMQEASGAPNSLPEWAVAAQDERIALLAHNVPDATQMRSVVAQAKTRGYGMLYVTDRKFGQDLWGGLPSYWLSLTQEVSS